MMRTTTVAPADDPETIIAYRLTELERRLTGMEARVDRKLTGIEDAIGALAFVRRDVFDEFGARISQRFDAVEAHAATTRTVAMWALGAVVTVIALVGSLVAALRLVGGG